MYATWKQIKFCALDDKSLKEFKDLVELDPMKVEYYIDRGHGYENSRKYCSYFNNRIPWNYKDNGIGTLASIDEIIKKSLQDDGFEVTCAFENVLIPELYKEQGNKILRSLMIGNVCIEIYYNDTRDISSDIAFYDAINFFLNNIDGKYIQIHYTMTSNVMDTINFIKKCLESDYQFFFDNNIENFNARYMYLENKIKKDAKIRSLFFDITRRFAQESHCMSKQVASLAVKDGRIIATGINGTIQGFPNCDETFAFVNENNREEHHSWSNEFEIHAEQNLVADSSKRGISLKDADVYCVLAPCYSCAKLLASIGIKNLFYEKAYDKGTNESLSLLRLSGVNVFKEVIS